MKIRNCVYLSKYGRTILGDVFPMGHISVACILPELVTLGDSAKPEKLNDLDPEP